MILNKILNKTLNKILNNIRLPIILLCILQLNLIHNIAHAKIEYQKLITQSGIPVFFVPDLTTQYVSVNFAYKNTGSKVDPKGFEGLGSMLIDLINRSEVNGLNKYQLNQTVQNLGALSGINMHISRDHIMTSFKCPKENLQALFKLISDLQLNPNLSQQELSILKTYNPGGSHLATSDEVSFAQKILFKKLFQGHPYGHPVEGSVETSQMMTLSDLKQNQKKRFTRDKLVFSIVGNIDQKILLKLIDQTFGSLKKSQEKETIADIQPIFSGEARLIQKDTPQSGVVFAQPSVHYHHPDYFAFSILNAILGGEPFTSRLWQKVREQKGLVYNIGTYNNHFNHANFLIGYFRAENNNISKVIELIKAEFKSIQQNGVTKKEFDNAQSGIIGSYVLQFSSPEGIANTILKLYLADFDLNYINIRNDLYKKVTLEDVNRVAKKYLTPEKLEMIIVGNPS